MVAPLTIYPESFDLCQVNVSLAGQLGSNWLASGAGLRAVPIGVGSRTGPNNLALDCQISTGVSAGDNCIYTFATPVANPICQFAFKLNLLTTRSTGNGAGFTWYNDIITNPAVQAYSFSCDSVGRPQIMRNGAVVYTHPLALTSNIYYSIGFQPVTTGAWNLYINGSLVHVGADTAFGSTVCMLAGMTNNDTPTALQSGGRAFVDDLWIYTSTSYLFDVAVYDLLPVSNGTPQDWTASAGSAFACIDNVPVDLAQYISAAAIGNISNFNCSNAPSTYASVLNVAVTFMPWLSAAGAETVRPLITQGASVTNGATVAPAVTFPSREIQSYATNPNTGLGWVPSDLVSGTLKLGFERVN